VPSGDHDVGAGLGERNRTCGADPTAGSGHDCCLALEGEEIEDHVSDCNTF
jgi:hypothetical protein